MVDLEMLTTWLLAGSARTRRHGRDRGDVPGWVMVTVMTAILVVAIIGVFKGQITKAITDALDSVSGSGSSGK
jgi:hypothetical protein